MDVLRFNPTVSNSGMVKFTTKNFITNQLSSYDIIVKSVKKS